MDLAVWEEGFVSVEGGPIHYRLHRSGSGLAPLVFLHEGLGSIGLWRGFPAAVLAAVGDRTMLVYSRHGYGQSVVVTEPRRADYMHTEGQVVLPALLEHFELANPILVGHSDGASISIVYAGSGFPCGGLILLAPHVFVESESISGIEAARVAFETTDMSARMGKHHGDPSATFWGWNNIWLSPEFANWNLENFVPKISAPILLIQGDQDEYGTVAQLAAIENQSGGVVQRAMIAGVGHSPHLAASEECVSAVQRFLGGSKS
jgi:pimeloyl-ACP methyl ester carboxylesterase